MNERLLQYIWQFQCYNLTALVTVENDPVKIINPGILNPNQGPDFLNAKIKVGTTIWAGTIELHVRSSDWRNHRHSEDKNYNNVVLHVVWDHDTDLILPFPTVVLQNRVSKILLHKYALLMQSAVFIPCEKNINRVNTLTWKSWMDRMIVERLMEKMRSVKGILLQNNNHWEETCWLMLANNFGGKVNGEAFFELAGSLPLSLLGKHRNQPQQIEALLFGQAGLLNRSFKDEYPAMLKAEYAFLKKKYRLRKLVMPVMFLRMRPANFPGIRLAQLARLLQQSKHLFAAVKNLDSVIEIKKMLDITPDDYWNDHYVFDDVSAFRKKILGAQTKHTIIINSFVPLLFTYGELQQEEGYKHKALQWLEELPAEKNQVTRGFEALGIRNTNAFYSQALYQLKRSYCEKKRCLDCAIGNKLIREE